MQRKIISGTSTLCSSKLTIPTKESIQNYYLIHAVEVSHLAFTPVMIDFFSWAQTRHIHRSKFAWCIAKVRNQAALQISYSIQFCSYLLSSSWKPSVAQSVLIWMCSLVKEWCSWDLVRSSSKTYHVRSFLEEELARRYRDAAPSTLALLQGRCESVTQELMTIDSQLKSVSDVASLRRAGRARK